MTINHVLPLKAARRNVIGASGHQLLNFGGIIYTRYAAPPYSDGTIITASVYGRWIKFLSYIFFGTWHSFVELKTVIK